VEEVLDSLTNRKSEFAVKLLSHDQRAARDLLSYRVSALAAIEAIFAGGRTCSVPVCSYLMERR